jgi:Tfp pilus assembly protein PilX
MKVSKGSKKLGKNEAGIALLMCLFSLLLLTAIGVGLMYMADSDSQVNQNYRDSQRAYFAAQAGIQDD